LVGVGAWFAVTTMLPSALGRGVLAVFGIALILKRPGSVG
jgi:hypothetical protein